MKVHYISDTHFDFHISEKLNQKNKVKLVNAIDYIFNITQETDYTEDIAIIGGDISHSEWQIEVAFEYLASKFAKVIIVLENHDYYLTSKNKCNKYENNSYNRVKNIEKLAANYGVKLLNREVHNFNGKTFAGATMWYPLQSDSERLFFNTFSNDSKLIKGVNIAEESFYDRHFFNQLYYTLGEDLDVFITHVPITSTPKNEQQGSDCYYCPVDWLPKLVLQGHTHENYRRHLPDSDTYMNAMGYDKLTKAIIINI